MPKFFLKRSNAEYDVAIELDEKGEAWPELRQICGDLVRSVVGEIPQNGTWEIEIQDEARCSLHMIKVIAETAPH